MIQAMEAHLAAWAQRQIQALSAESDLFGHVRMVAGQLTLPPGPPLGQTEVAALVQVHSLQPQPESRDMGPRPVTEGAFLRMTARATLRLLGRTTPYPADSGLAFTPATAPFHRVDVAALALLALLREQPGPAADGPVLPLIARPQGEQPAGAGSAAHGARRAFLAWTGWEVGEVAVVPRNEEAYRQWEIALTAACQFRLTPAALEGGRILQIGVGLTVENRPPQVREATVTAAETPLPPGR